MPLCRRCVCLVAVFMVAATVAVADGRPSSHGIWPMGWSDDGAALDTVYCFDEQTGEELW